MNSSGSSFSGLKEDNVGLFLEANGVSEMTPSSVGALILQMVGNFNRSDATLGFESTKIVKEDDDRQESEVDLSSPQNDNRTWKKSRSRPMTLPGTENATENRVKAERV